MDNELKMYTIRAVLPDGRVLWPDLRTIKSGNDWKETPVKLRTWHSRKNAKIALGQTFPHGGTGLKLQGFPVSRKQWVTLKPGQPGFDRGLDFLSGETYTVPHSGLVRFYIVPVDVRMVQEDEQELVREDS